MIGLALRTYLRYLVPLTLLALVALVPLVYVALKVPVPVDLAQARSATTIAIGIAGVAIVFQLWLVGAAAPLVREVAAGTPLSQPRAVMAGLGGLARGALPWLCALAATFTGLLALVVPGVVALVLFSLAAASDAPGLPAPLVESARIVRQHGTLVAAILVALVVLDLGIAVAAKELLIAPLPKKLDPKLLPPFREVVRVALAGAIVVAPLGATLLAAIHARSQPAVKRGA